MEKRTTGEQASGGGCALSAREGAVPEYGPGEALIANIPYLVLTIMGAVVFVAGWNGPIWNWVLGGAYFLYGVCGALLIMLFVCPFCRYHGTNSCPCGYGKIAAKARKKQEVECFDKRFKTYNPMIVPLWFLPLIFGVYIAVQHFSWGYAAILAVFAIDGFVILPLVSSRHGCKECPQRGTCPWMKPKGLGSAVTPSH